MKFLALILTLSLSACLKDETISGQIDPSEIWHLTQMNGTPVAGEITLTFPEKGQIAGKAPCNQYSAPQTAVLPWFELGPIRATKRACPDLKLESSYLQSLSQMTLIERAGDTLILSNDGDQTLEYRLK